MFSVLEYIVGQLSHYIYHYAILKYIEENWEEILLKLSFAINQTFFVISRGNTPKYIIF